MSSIKSFVSQSVGAINHWNAQPDGITGKCTHNTAFKIQFYSHKIVRVTLTREDFFETLSYSVVAQPQDINLSIQDDDQKITIQSDAVQLQLSKKSFRLTFLNSNGEIINEDDALGTSWIGEQVTAYKKLQEGERFLGLGEKTGPLDRKGTGYTNWNTDAYAYHSGSDPLYCSTPFYIGVHHGLVYGIFFDNTYKSFFNFGASNNRFASFGADSGEMNYYFIHGKTVAEVINQYTHLTGRMELPPLWSLGYQQCRYSYYPDKEVLSIGQTFHDKDIPVDAIVFDIHYMQDYKIFTWSEKDFPDPKGLIQKLKELNLQVVVMCDPGIKTEDGYHTYESGKAQDVYIKYPDGENYTGQVWPGWCHFPDFTNPKTRAWWKDQFKDYVNLGIAGFWNDMNEIATWGNMLPENIEFDFEGNRTTARRGRNIYGFQMARSTFEATKELMNGRRPFNLTRSGFSGVQRYAAVWTGDNVAYDEHMLLGVRLVNSMGLTGIAFAGYDVGGFVGNADEKLFARWISIGAFSPFFRGHSMINSRDSEPWSYGEKVEEISRNYIKLRYRLMPYLYSLFFDAAKTGIPINRSLAIDFTFDGLIYDHRYHHQYLFGPAILVAPVESTRDLTKVYLPKGDWFEFFTDKKHSGNQEIVAECPIERLPLYVKGSSIISMRGKAGSHTSDYSDTLELHIYKGEQDNSFLLYDDDGISYEHENGNFCKRLLEFKPGRNEFKINESEGAHVSPYRFIEVYFHGFNGISTIHCNETSVSVQYKDYRFVEPISNYDPVNRMPEGPVIIQLPFINIPYDQKKLVIRW